jgi:hypothetical protein
VKVAIVGMAPSGDGIIPWRDPDWEIWGLNDLYLLYHGDGPNDPKPFTGWWELHGDTPLTRDRRPAGHFDVIKAMNIPVYYLHGDPPTPNAVKVDVDALAKQGRDYFACTFAYQIAKAMEMGATEIALFGTPLATNREVVVERPCVAYWLGLAEGRGIKVSVHHVWDTALLRHPFRYALDDRQEREAAMYASVSARNTIDEWLWGECNRLGAHLQVIEETVQ